jgi:translation initiation factor 1
MAKRNNKQSGFVYSTNPEFDYSHDDLAAESTLPPQQQLLYVSHDRKLRKGKTVTLVEGFVGQAEDLENLTKALKTKCGVGGSAKEGKIVLQGELKSKVVDLLEAAGYRVKHKGG